MPGYWLYVDLAISALSGNLIAPKLRQQPCGGPWFIRGKQRGYQARAKPQQPTGRQDGAGVSFR